MLTLRVITWAIIRRCIPEGNKKIPDPFSNNYGKVERLPLGATSGIAALSTLPTFTSAEAFIVLFFAGG